MAAAGPSNRFRAIFEVPYAPGVLSAIAIRDGERRERTEVRSDGPVTHLTATLEPASPWSPGTHRFVSIELTDSSGELVPIDDRIVSASASVTGGVELAGLGTSRPATTERYSTASRTTFEGRAQAVVRSIGNAEATVTIQVDGLMPTVIAVPGAAE